MCAKSTIGITHFFLYWSRRACVRHTWWRTKRSWPLFSPTFFFFSFFFFSAFYFSPTSGNLPCVKICFPQYFCITRRYVQKKIGNFDFWAFFLFFTASIRSRPPGPPLVSGVLKNVVENISHFAIFPFLN